MLYTDLTDDGSGAGKVMCKRTAQTYFMSCAEVVFAAGLQNDHPNRTRHSPTGRFGSKFVTVIATGDADQSVHLLAYQVSNQAMALVASGLVQPTVEPAVMRVTTETEGRVIPDILFKFQNEYGTSVTQAAKPSFPVDYLLVNVRERRACWEGWSRVPVRSRRGAGPRLAGRGLRRGGPRPWNPGPVHHAHPDPG